MRFDLTPAAERALIAAAGWTSAADSDDLRPPEILLGLLAEPECRAALILARYNLDADAVRQRFGELRPAPATDSAAGRGQSPAWHDCLHALETLLIEYPRGFELATEHLLLGLTATDNEVSRWLAERGLYPDALEAEVHRLSGHQPGPLPLDMADEPQWFATNPALAESPAGLGPAEEVGVLRIVDAAANRASEGLRVVEDYLRFVLDDPHLTSLAKSLRHDLTAALRTFASADRHAARDTLADVGTALSTAAERERSDLTAVLTANFKRLEQSLRSLEEYSKAIDPAVSATLEQLRYRVYTLERAADITHTALQRLATARLYVLVDGRATEREFVALVESLIGAGVSVLQLRDKHLTDRELLARAHVLRELTRDTQALFIVNDRPDLAALSNADGVHVGQEELSVKDARQIVGPRALVGVSTHSLEQARAAVLGGANYIGVGPTFPSGTKSFESFTGPELLRAVSAEIRLPAFAIGGITQENLPQVLSAGFTRIAVSGAVTAQTHPAEAARALLAALTA